MKRFQQKKSEHYIFNYLPDTLAEREIDRIILTQEKSYEKILSFLGTQNEREITYFLYPSNSIKGEISGDDGNGHADRKKFEVHAVYNGEVKCIGPHEDTHLLANSLGLPPQLFREGLAEFMTGNWDGRKHDEIVLEILHNNLVPRFDTIIDDEEWYKIDENITYPAAGSVVSYLITRFGKEIFVSAYKTLHRDLAPRENKQLFERIFKSSIDDLQDDWQNILSKK